MVDFAGWSMPVQYSSIVEEHLATRTKATLFDISHMGRLRFDGDRSDEFLDGLLTRRVIGMKPGAVRYSLMTNEDGGILDDVLVYHIEKPSGPHYHLLVVNASNREKIVDWIRQHNPQSYGIDFYDRTEDTAMIAVQGPAAVEVANKLVNVDVGSLKYYQAVVTKQMGKVCLASRTGYTGEDGCELIVKAEEAQQVWDNLLMAGRDIPVTAAGLGARDTLRLESAMPLYGHELSETINPIQAGLNFAVNVKDREFVGRDALTRFREDPKQLKRVGLELSGRRVPREHYPVCDADAPVGEITSGTFSPTLQRPIAMAYVPLECSEVGRQLQVDIRGRLESAKVVPLPFYQRS